ncbi:MAG: SLC13/DASS family transporter [Candidatus Zixiibacteriota bacterium]|nr:MAG: SLC13/DASS family transporter [candidate division Zixibacteria bacterium]
MASIDTENGNGFSRGKIIGLVSGIVLFIIFVFNIPGFDMPPQASATAGVVLLMACFWVSLCLPIPVTSLLPIVLFPILGVASSGATVKYYANNNIYLFMGGFIIALAIEKWGLHRRIALTITSLLGTSPARVVMGFMCGTAFMSMWISNTATTMMMLPIGLAVISETVKLTGKETGFAVVLMLGIAYGASVGGIATPIGTPPNIEFLGQFERGFPDAPGISFFKWIKVFFPLTVILIPLVWFVLIKVLGLKSQKAAIGRKVIKEELRKLGPMNSAEKRIMVIFALTAFLWIFRADIVTGLFTVPGWSRLLPYPDLIHDATVAVFMAIILFIIPAGKKHAGKFLMDWPTARKLPWGILLLFGGGFAIAGGFTISGLDKLIGLALKPYLVFHPLIIVFMICLLLTFLTELTSNTATTAALLPIMKGTALALGFNPLLLMIPATISASMAFMLPVATPPNAIVFASGRIKMGEMVRVGLVLNLFIAIIVACFVYFLVLPAWGYDASMPTWAQ